MTEVDDFMKQRDDLFNDMTLERATAFWKAQRLPVGTSVPLAAAHKARLQWLWATNAMLNESIKWLVDNGYETTYMGVVPPLTPEERDRDREALGLGKLSCNPDKTVL